MRANGKLLVDEPRNRSGNVGITVLSTVVLLYEERTRSTGDENAAYVSRAQARARTIPRLLTTNTKTRH